jgi:predicted NUDIX family phosphoesterase
MSSHREKILCISSEKLFHLGKWNGLQTENLDKYLKLLNEQSEFRVRDELEDDDSYKQVIAQVILRYKDKYFLHRQVNRSEDRLNSLCPLALGGHTEEFDMKEGEDILDVALERELHEEVELKSKILKKKLLGLMYIEDENPVNRVHVGLFYVYDLDGIDVHIREEGLEDIGFVSLDYLKTNKETLTFWSRVIIYHL